MPLPPGCQPLKPAERMDVYGRNRAKEGRTPPGLSDFAHLRDIVGFPDYYEAEKKYAAGE